MRIHLRLARGDLDLQYLFAHNNVNEMVPELVRSYLQGKGKQIPLPPLVRPRKMLKGIYIILDDRTDKDVIQWYRGLAKGYASSALKLLIRWSMEDPELRVFEQNHAVISSEERGVADKQAQPKREKMPPAPSGGKPAAPRPKPAPLPMPAQQAEPEDDEGEKSPLDFI